MIAIGTDKDGRALVGFTAEELSDLTCALRISQGHSIQLGATLVADAEQALETILRNEVLPLATVFDENEVARNIPTLTDTV